MLENMYRRTPTIYLYISIIALLRSFLNFSPNWYFQARVWAADWQDSTVFFLDKSFIFFEFAIKISIDFISEFYIKSTSISHEINVLFSSSFILFKIFYIYVWWNINLVEMEFFLLSEVLCKRLYMISMYEFSLFSQTNPKAASAICLSLSALTKMLHKFIT